jgi:hypothetical protein
MSIMPKPSPPRLSRQRNFLLFWTGESISEFGNSVTIVVVPLVAVDTLHASTFIVTLLTAMVWLPWVIIGIPDLTEANATLLGSREVAQIGGPGLGGLLAQAAGP